MTKPNISSILTDGDKAIIKSDLDDARSKMPFLANLTPDERHRLRTAGSKREGYVVDVYTGCINNPGALPADFTIAEWTKDENLNKQLIEVLGWCTSLMEAVDDTRLLLSSERMKQADAGYGFLKQGAKGNSTLTKLVEQIARQFTGMGRRKDATAFEVPAKGNVEVHNVKPGTKVVNTGDAILSMKAGSELAKIVKKTAIMINPGTSATVPDGYTSIIVENLSETADGSFTIQVK